MDLDEFTIYFNKHKQWILVHLWDVNPGTFANWGGGRWGYFQPSWQNPKQGLFGEVHLVKSRVRPDLVVHELDHVRIEWWFRANKRDVTGRNEERFVSFLDELVRKFYREYSKIIKKGGKN